MKHIPMVLRALFVCLVVVASQMASQNVFAQGRVAKYSQTNFTSTFTSISTTGTSFLLNRYYYGGTATLTLPFAFPYDGGTIASGQSIIVSDYCAINLAGSSPSTSDLGDPSFPKELCFFNADMFMGDGANGDNVNYYKTTGITPNRVFTIECRRIHFQRSGGGSGTGGVQTTVQIKLYETTGIIEYIYKDHSKAMSGGTATIGLNGSSSPSFSSLTTSSGSSSTPATDIRYTPPPPPSQLSLQPKTLNFGNVVAGSPVSLTVTAQSVGPNTLHISGIGLSGNPDFSVSGGARAGDSIAPGGSSTYTITFNPFASGTRTGTFTLTTDGGDSGTQRVSLIGVGITPAVSYDVSALYRKTTTRLGDTAKPQYFHITSNGTGPLTVKSVTIGGLNRDQYFISRFPTSPLPTGSTDSIGVSFKPTFEGRPDAYVIVSTDAINNPLDTIRLFGVGILPRLALSTTASGLSNSLSFDSVAIGDSICKVVTLSNPGSDTLRITRQLKSSGDFDFAFYPLTGSDTAIAPNQTKAFNVCFTPLKNGSRQATYRFYTNIPRNFPGPGDTSQIVLNITGVGVPVGRLTFAGARIDSEIIGTKGCQDVKVNNVGLSDFTVTSVAISGLNASDFTDNITPPLVIPAGGSQTVNICFTPTGRGARIGTVTVTGSSAGRNQTIAVPLAGVGLQQCASAAPMSLFSTPTLVGSTDTAVVTVTNCGDVATSYTTNLTGTGYTVTPATSGAVAAGGTAKFVVHYTPTTLTNNAGTLVVNGGAGITPMTITLGGSGGGVALSATGNAGQVAKGNCKNFDIAVTNTGNVAWTPNGGSISGANGNDFTIVSSPSSVGANGGTGTITIKFCPTTVGSETASLIYTGTPAPLTGGSIMLSGSGVVNAVSSPVVDRGYELDQSYPNPAKSVADVRFVLPAEAVVHITLMDASGASVRTITNERFSSGEHAVTIDTHDLASGTYFYVLSSNGIQLTKQMTVVK